MADTTPPPKRRPTFEQFTAVRRYQPTLAFSPDGSEVVYAANTSGQFNLWRQASDGGYPRQLTLYADHTVRHVAWSPDGSTLLYTADRQGAELYLPHLIPASGGQPKPFPAEPDVCHYLGTIDAWSPDGRWVAYAANDRKRTDQDVLVRNIETGEVRRVLAGDANYYPVAWSPDGDCLTAIEWISNTKTAAHIVSVADGSSRRLMPDGADAKVVPGPWGGGSGLWLLSDEGREFVGLAFYDLTKDACQWVETPDWDVEHVGASKDGHILVWSVNKDSYSHLYARDVASGTPLALPEIPRGVVSVLTVSPDGGKVGLLLNRATHPTEVFILDLGQLTTTQITHGFLGGLAEADLIEPELVRFPTFDGRQIPAFLYLPKGDGSYPVVLSIHGGPQSQERAQYGLGMYQYLLSRGIGILAPNVRGSTGYGRSYQKLIQRDWGGDELKDFDAAVKYLRSLSRVDPDRIGVFGGSYGGFAVLSCVSRLPDYWAAAVDIVGPSNLVTFAKAVPPDWRRHLKDDIGDPETEADFLLSRSPITYADQIQTPLFVIQGANDPRVVKAESDQIVERLRARGVDVRYDVYDDEGHGFTERENELKAFRDTTAFFERYLTGEGQTTARVAVTDPPVRS